MNARASSPGRARIGAPMRTSTGYRWGRALPFGRTRRIPTTRHWQHLAAGVPGEQPDARLERVDVARRRPRPLREQDDVPACGEQALGGGDGVRATARSVEGERPEPRRHEPADSLRREVVGGRGGGDAAAVLRPEGEADRGEVEVAGVRRGDERRALELGEVLSSGHPRPDEEPADDRAEQARGDLAGDDGSRRELPAARRRDAPVLLASPGRRALLVMRGPAPAAG